MNRCSSEGIQLILDADIANLFTLCYDAVAYNRIGWQSYLSWDEHFPGSQIRNTWNQAHFTHLASPCVALSPFSPAMWCHLPVLTQLKAFSRGWPDGTTPSQTFHLHHRELNKHPSSYIIHPLIFCYSNTRRTEEATKETSGEFSSILFSVWNLFPVITFVIFILWMTVFIIFLSLSLSKYKVRLGS